MQKQPQHPNGMRFSVFDDQGSLLATNEYFSIGGGFVVNDETEISGTSNAFVKNNKPTSLESSKKSSLPVSVPYFKGSCSHFFF